MNNRAKKSRKCRHKTVKCLIMSYSTCLASKRFSFCPFFNHFSFLVKSKTAAICICISVFLFNCITNIMNTVPTRDRWSAERCNHVLFELEIPPAQFCPFPVNPGLHVQLCDPSVLLHSALALHL